MVDGRVMVRGTFPASVADDGIGGFDVAAPRTPRDARELSAALHSGPLKAPLVVVST
jgi:hypothetical protein